MSILVNIVTADEDEAEAIAFSQHPVDEWSGIEARDLDTAKIAMLHCLLTGEGFEDVIAAYEPVFTVGDEGPMVLKIAPEVMDHLAALEEEALEQVGEELAGAEVFERHGWPLEEVQALLAELSDLARLAESQGQMMFVWMHPLLT